MAAPALKQIRKTYDGGAEVIKGVDLGVRDGEFRGVVPGLAHCAGRRPSRVSLTFASRW